jgi:hypothetical protein
MPVVPTVPALGDGILLPGDLNAGLIAAINFVLYKPIARLQQSVGQSLPNAAWTTLTWDVEYVDDDPDHVGGHDNAVNNSRYTARYAGHYGFGGGVSFVANAVGVRGSRWAVNGVALAASGVVVQAVTTAAITTEIPATAIVFYLNLGDYVEMQAFQSSGGALLTNVSAASASSMRNSWERN